jgi:molecular chaperone DnaK (HSP70)
MVKMSDIRDLEFWKTKCEFTEKERDYWIENTKEVNVELEDLHLKLEIANLDTKLVDYWIRQFKQKEQELEKATEELEELHRIREINGNMLNIQVEYATKLIDMQKELKRTQQELEKITADLIGERHHYTQNMERLNNMVGSEYWGVNLLDAVEQELKKRDEYIDYLKKELNHLTKDMEKSHAVLNKSSEQASSYRTVLEMAKELYECEYWPKCECKQHKAIAEFYETLCKTLEG